MAVTNTVGFNVHDSLERRAKILEGKAEALSWAGLAKKIGIDLAISAAGYYVTASAANPPPEPGTLRDVAMAPANSVGEFERVRLRPEGVTEHLLAREFNELTYVGRLGWEGFWRNISGATQFRRLWNSADPDNPIHDLISPETWAEAQQDQERIDGAWGQVVRGEADSTADHVVRLAANAYDYLDSFREELLGLRRQYGPVIAMASGSDVPGTRLVWRARIGRAAAAHRMGEDWQALTSGDDGSRSAGSWDDGAAAGGSTP